MKKKALAIAFLLASLVTSVQSEEVNKWYLGTKLGWSQFSFLKHNTNDTKATNDDSSSDTLSAPILGLFLGYEFNPYLSLELENNTNGFSPFLFFKKHDTNNQFNSVQLATKLSYPITNDFRIYSRLGGKMLWNDLTSKEQLKEIFTKQSSLSPSLSLGAEYIINNKYITRLDYTWKSKIENIVDRSVKPCLGDAVFSFGWKFGTSHIHKIFSSNYSKVPNQQYTVLNENINFPFNSSEIKPDAYEKLEKLNNHVKKMKLKNMSIIILGHSDRIGHKKYNQKLSEDRANIVKRYLISKGVNKNQIIVQGMGKLYPLTNHFCNNIKNKDLLISCLAPDRRVEIEVLSTQ